MQDPSFVHLHVHTEFSMLDGAAKLKDLFKEASRMGMPALAMTDHGNVFGAYDFWKQATAAGVNPIIGIEGYLAPGSRHDRKRVQVGQGSTGGDESNPGEMYTHMTLLSETTEGMHNLFRLSSLSSLEGYYYQPRMDRELLERYGKGIIATTGCPSGEVQRLLQQNRYDAAVQAASDYRDIFGKENFFCEVMDHGIGIEQQVRHDLIRLGKQLDLPFVATNDLHYTFQEDAVAHEVLLCVQTGATLADPKRFKFDAQDFWLKPADQMRHVWREMPEACDNTLLIAERCHVEFTEGRNLMPRFPCPEGEDEVSWLIKEVERGLHTRFPNGIPADRRKQAEYETQVIVNMGFPGYFLVTADLVRYAKTAGIRVGPGRGSAAGSMVAFVMGITELDPITHGLLFERFLNPDRISMPDIDMDFDERRRGDMIRYATETYGEDRVAQIITYGTIKAKQALKDSARVLGYPYAMGDQLTKAMPAPVMGKDIPLAGIFDPAHDRYGEAGEFRALYETNPDAKKVIDTARGLEGLKRQWGVHAAGVIMSSEPLIDVVPIMRRPADGAIITQFDMGACETLGLLKMDFLGLRNLTVLDDCLIHIKANAGKELVLEELALDDQATYDLLSRGDTLGVFQLDGGPMRALMRSLKPTSFDDVSALIALYRPGPMGVNAHNDYADRKNDRKPVVPIHPELAEALEEILAESYGLIIYQEQVMAIAQRLAGYTLGQADLLRRAMGKKKKEILDKEYLPFSDGMKANGYGDAAIKIIWETLVPFADYAFNKAHSAGYGLVSYWTGYLKANYPAEYMAALLTSVQDDKSTNGKIGMYLQECRRMGIKVLPPDVNESTANFTPVGSDIRFGLAGIRNVGHNVVASIMATRQSKGRFTDTRDFLRKVDAVVCNKRVMESLIKAGAFDAFGDARRGLMAIHAEAVDAVLSSKRKEAEGQFDLFGGGAVEEDGFDFLNGITISEAEWDKPALLAFEREMLGLYVSDHPLFGVEHILAEKVDCSVSSLSEKEDGAVVTIGGLMASISRKMTKNGSPWASAVVEDLDGSIEVMFFPQTYLLAAPHLAEDTVVTVKGRVQKRDEELKFIAMDISIPELNTGGQRGPLQVSIQAARCTAPLVDRFKQVLASYPGTTEVRLQLIGSERTHVLRLDDQLRVAVSAGR